MTLHTHEVKFDLRIDAPPARVWKALVEETAGWWLKEYSSGPKFRAMVIEPRLDGRMYEDWGDGAGVVWYRVVALDPPQRIELIGHLTPAFGGPALTMMRIELKASGRATRLMLADTLSGRVTEETAQSITDGWTKLLRKGLKTYVERRND